MFKLQLKWMKQGEWIDCVYPPTPYAVAFKRWQHYTALHGEDHTYRILNVS